MEKQKKTLVAKAQVGFRFPVNERQVRLPNGSRVYRGADGNLYHISEETQVPFSQPIHEERQIQPNPFMNYNYGYQPDAEVTKTTLTVPQEEYDSYVNSLNDYEKNLTKKLNESDAKAQRKKNLSYIR